MDNLCDLRIFAKCDDVMTLLMKKLEMPIPDWQRLFYLKVSQLSSGHLKFEGVDKGNRPFMFFNRLQVKGLGAVTTLVENPDEDMLVALPKNGASRPKAIEVTLSFFKRHQEPDLTFSIALNDFVRRDNVDGTVFYEMRYGAGTDKTWNRI